MKKFIFASAIVLSLFAFIFAGVDHAGKDETEVYERPFLVVETNYKLNINDGDDGNDGDEEVWHEVAVLEYEEEQKRPFIPDIPLDDDLLDYIWNKADEEDLSYELILAICAVESNFNSDAYSATSDSGLAQINQANIEWLSEKAEIEDVDPMNPYHSIDMMIELINYEREYFYSIGMYEEDVYWSVLIAYNMGRGNALKYIKKNGYDYSYAKKVDKMKQFYEKNAIYEP